MLFGCVRRCVLSKLPENCPACGEKMVKGYISTGQQIGWSNKKPGPVVLRGEEIIVGSLWSGTRAEAFRCPNCKIVLFSYGEETEKE
jgi:predicted RNA-binding Zn-ribbon protein involved in translation (DUF1610 family)